MKKMFLKVILLLFILSPVFVNAKEVNLYLFHSKDCLHCKAELKWLNEIKDDYDYLNVHEFEVTRNEDNSGLLEKVKTKFQTNTPYVPFTVIGEQYWIGFGDNTKSEILEYIETYDNNSRNIVEEAIQGNLDVVEKNNNQDEEDTENATKYEKDIPLLGKVNVKEVSIPLMSIVIGLVDGFNPCAMWILIFLISILMGMNNRKRMWILGLTFIITSALVYLGFMFAWFNVAVSLLQIMWVRFIVALFAIIGAGINLNSWYKSVKQKDDGCQVVDNKKRKKIMNYIREFTGKKSFIIAIIGIMGLAVSVNLIELACSAGLPLLFTQIRALNNVTTLASIGYTSLYILCFLFDDLLIFIIAMITFKITGISTKYTKYSHLIGGIIMLIIGILMIFKPDWLMFNFG